MRYSKIVIVWLLCLVFVGNFSIFPNGKINDIEIFPKSYDMVTMRIVRTGSSNVYLSADFGEKCTAPLLSS